MMNIEGRDLHGTKKCARCKGRRFPLVIHVAPHLGLFSIDDSLSGDAWAAIQSAQFTFFADAARSDARVLNRIVYIFK